MHLKRLTLVAFGILLVAVPTYFLLADKSSLFTTHNGCLFLEIRNESDKTMIFSAFVYLDKGRVKFSNTTIVPLSGNFSYAEIVDSSGIELYSRELQAKTSLILRVDNITLTPIFSSDLSGLELSIHSTGTFNENDIGYDAVFSARSEYNLSFASRHFFTVRLSEQSRYARYEDRVAVSTYLNELLIITVLIGVGIILSQLRQKVEYWFPFVTAIVIWSSIFLYVFVGSGPEINTIVSPKAPFVVLSFLIHGDNWHLNGNLIYFIIVSLLFEIFIKIRNKSVRRDLVIWYALPLTVPVLLSVLQFVGRGGFGYGLSFSIEIMTWALWAYIISKSTEVLTRKIHILCAILSGIPSYGFFNWLFSLFLGTTDDPYTWSLAMGHVLIGIISAFVIMGVVFGKDILTRLKGTVRRKPKQQNHEDSK
jgi:hypothetical protein